MLQIRPMALILVLFLLAGGALQAQDTQPAVPPAPSRPRIGVALAGGSALGLAHIGVLKWFDDHHIPVDYVAGTSMGGLVGGMYASGYSPDEMRELVRATDWGRVFGPPTTYADLNFRRKEDQRVFANELELGWRSGLRFPPGFNTGQGVSLVLSRFAAPYAEMNTFDDLPTPFRCVAVDLVKREQVVFHQGSLLDALRATMSLPTVFPPVRVGGRVLVDGGLLNNLPVDVARKMGSDVVIAVELDTPPPTPESLESLLKVGRESLTTMIFANERRSLAQADLVVSPDLNGLDSSDFERWQDLEERGYAAAEAKARFLKTLAVSDAEWERYLEARRSRRRNMETPQRIEVRGAGGESAAVRAELQPLVGQPFDPEHVEHSMDQLAGHGRFSTATYQQFQRDRRNVLEVTLHEKRYGPPFINWGLTIDGSQADDPRFGFGARITWLGLGVPSAEWRNDLNLGRASFLSSEYYWRVGGGRWFLAPRAFVGREKQDVWDRSARIAEYNLDRVGGAADLGFVLGPTSEFRIGYELAHVDAFSTIGASTLPELRGTHSSVRARWLYDGTDSPTIPTSGVRGEISAGWVLDSPGATQAFPTFQSRWLAARQVAPKYLLIGTAAGGSNFGRGTPVDAFVLGGPLRLSALGRDELRGGSFYNGGLALLRTLSRDPTGLATRTYFVVGYEMGDAFDDAANANTFHDVALGLMGVTRLGVYYVGGSVGEQGEKKVFFRFGRLFF
ncbi:MAG TPA: patatin-like phospholipase family protein [Terriglobales bacterium]|nr:patatin-like phospholipase family protein [Terriglobales bacterium]